MAYLHKIRQFQAQEHDFSCFPVSVINACIWARVTHPDIEELIDVALCRNGTTIRYKEVLDMTPLNWIRTTEANVLRSQGSVTIQHPKWGLHQIFVYRDYGKLYGVNAGLSDKLVDVLDPYELPFPKHPHHQRAWAVFPPRPK